MKFSQKSIYLAIVIGVSLAPKALAQGTAGITNVGSGGSPYSVNLNDSTIYCNNASASTVFTINLPQVSKFGNRVLEIRNVNSTGLQAPCNIAPATGESIEGAASSSTNISLASRPNIGGGLKFVPGYQSRKLQADNSVTPGIWHILNGVNGNSVFARCIPSGDITIIGGQTVSNICNSTVMPCYPFDPGVGNTYMSVGLSQLVLTYTGPTPAGIATQLTLSCAVGMGPPVIHQDGHGDQFISTSPMTTTVVGAIDSTNAQDDLLNPADPNNVQCLAVNGGGCSVQISVTVYGKTLGAGNSFPTTVKIRKGPGFGSPPNGIGADTAILIEDKMHYNMGR